MTKAIFISYSHDSVEHREKVLGLAARLRQDGLDARLDQQVNGTPEQGWPRWMLDQLDEAAFVLVVCTEIYYRRFRGRDEAGRGKGADWEGTIITLELYEARNRTIKFVPVLLSVGQALFIPEPLRGKTYYELTSEERYGALYAFLVGQAGVDLSPLGAMRLVERPAPHPLAFGPAPLAKVATDEKVQNQYAEGQSPVSRAQRAYMRFWSSKEFRSRIVIALAAALIGLLFGSLGLSRAERRGRAAEDAERRLKTISIIEDKSTEVDLILGKMIEAADQSLASWANEKSPCDASLTDKLKKFQGEIDAKAWDWPEEVAPLLELSELAQFQRDAPAYKDLVGQQLELTWKLHALCQSFPYPAGEVALAQMRLHRVQLLERKSFAATRALLHRQ